MFTGGVGVGFGVSAEGLANLIEALAVEPLLAHALVNSEAIGCELAVADGQMSALMLKDEDAHRLRLVSFNPRETEAARFDDGGKAHVGRGAVVVVDGDQDRLAEADCACALSIAALSLKKVSPPVLARRGKAWSREARRPH